MSSTPALPDSSGSVTVPLRWVRWICLGYWLTLAVFTHWPRLDLGTPPPDESGLPTDKLLHFGAFGLLCALLIHAKPAGRSAARWLNVTFACLVVAAYAYVDEFSQVYFADRIASWGDVAANWSAVFAFLVAGLWQPVRDWRKQQPIAFYRIVLAGSLVAFGVLCVVSPLTLRPLRPWMWEFNNTFGETVGKFDHTGHFVVAMVLTWLILAARPLGARRPWLSASVCLGLFAASAPLIEWVQIRFGRAYEWADVRAHFWGIAAGVVIAGLWWLLRRTTRRVLRRIPRRTHSGKHEAEHGFVRHATIVSALTLASRFTGLARDAVLAAAFGRSAIASAFLIGFLVPNLFRRLFGEGALSSALIPEYSKWLGRDRGTARKLITLTLLGMVVVLGGLMIVGEGVLLGLLNMRDWSPASALAIELAMWMLPYMPMVCVVAVLGAVLQVHGRFAAAASAPILLNLCMIAGIVWAADGLLSQHLFSTETGSTSQMVDEAAVNAGEAIDPAGAIAMTVVAGSVLIAGLLQLGYLILPAKDVESLDLDVRGWRTAWLPFKSMMAAFIPMVAGLAVFQFNALLDSLIAMGLSPPSPGNTTFDLLGWAIAYPVSDKGQVAALHWAQRLYQFPLGVFGIAIATAVFPALSHAAAQRHNDGEKNENSDSAFRSILQRGLRLTVFIGLPASVGLMLVRLPLVRAIFERGEFGLEDAREVARILLPYAAAVWAYSMVHVLTRAYYALGDPKSPVRISLKMAGLNFLINMVLVWPLGAGGLAWSTAITAALQCAVLVRGLAKRTAGLVDDKVISGWKRSALATALMGAGVWLAMMAGERMGAGVWRELMGSVAVGVLVYAAAAWLLGCQEIHWLTGRHGQRGRKL